VTTYLDKHGRQYRVGDGIGNPVRWGTFYQRKIGGGKHRLVSLSLPMRETREEAEKDLALYARKRKFAVKEDLKSIPL
jgi:hypothetical protein